MVVATPHPNSAEISLRHVLENIPAESSTALKMDIEGWEFSTLLSCPDELLSKIRFFVAEFHGIADAVATENTATLEATWRKLSSKFDTVHIHANNAGGARVLGGALIPNLLEITMVNRDLYKTSASMEAYPNSLDRPNIKEKAEIQLNSLVCGESFENDISHFHK